MREEKIKVELASKGHHLVLNTLKGKKNFSKLKKEVFYVDPGLCSYLVKGGVFTRKRAVRVWDVTAIQDGVSLFDVLTSFSGNWERKWLSQSQISKVCKHFKKWLKEDDYGNIFVCKVDEFREFDEDDPLSNLMLVVVFKDHDKELRIHKMAEMIWFAKRWTGFPFRIFLPAR